jgi:hypothetical protein
VVYGATRRRPGSVVEEKVIVRRVLLTVVLLVSFLGITATPAAAPTWCPAEMTSRDIALKHFWLQKFVAAEISRGGDDKGLLRARTDPGQLGPWERFRLVCVQGPDVYAIRSVANGKYVTAEISWTGSREGLLRARADAIGPWERFRIGYGTVGTPIYSLAANRYVTAEVNWTGTSQGSLRARVTAVNDWEWFNIYWF